MATQLKANAKKRVKASARQEASAAKAAKRIHSVKAGRYFFKGLIYARGKMGKTTFGASGGAIGLKTLIIDFNEEGQIAVNKQPNVDVYTVEYWDELDWIYWYLRSGKHDYKVVVLDTVTSMASICMKWVLGDLESRDANREPMIPDKRAWGKLGELMKLRIVDFRNLPMHVVFTAHERTTTVEDEETDAVFTEVVPSLSPAPREALIGAVHLIGRLFTREVEVKSKKSGKTRRISERRLLIGPDPKYVSGIRLDKDAKVQPPRVVRNPTLGYFIDLMIPQKENQVGG